MQLRTTDVCSAGGAGWGGKGMRVENEQKYEETGAGTLELIGVMWV